MAVLIGRGLDHTTKARCKLSPLISLVSQYEAFLPALYSVLKVLEALDNNAVLNTLYERTRVQKVIA